MRPRTCPNCLAHVAIEEGFSWDDKLNMICDVCGKPMYSTGWASDEIIGNSLRAITPVGSWKYELVDKPPIIQHVATPARIGVIKRFPDYGANDTDI